MLACTRLALHKGKDMSEVKRFSVGVDAVDPNGNPVRYVDYAALQQKLDAVLAENVALREYLKECSIVQGEGNWASDTDKSVYVPATEWLPPTPATDAILDAVRADAIEQAAERAPWLYGDQMGRSVEAIPKEQLIKWAAQLRAETDTTSSQYESLAGGK